MKYTKKELRNSLKNKFNANSKLIAFLVLIFVVPVFILASIIHPPFIALLFLLIIFIPKTITKNLDVILERVDFGDFLVLGNISFKKSETYAWDNNIINPNKYVKFHMTDYFLKNRTVMKNEKLNHYIVKINASRLRKSKILIEVFDFTLMDIDRLEIYEQILQNIFTSKRYTNRKNANKAYTDYLTKITEIYEGTKVKYCSDKKNIDYWRIKNLEKHLEINPKPFIKFVMSDNYELPKFYKYNLAGEKLEQVFISETEFAKLLYYDVLEALQYSVKITDKKGYHFIFDRM